MAYLQLGRSKEQARNEDAPRPAATTTAPGDAGAKPADTAQDSPGPSAADLRELADWFDVLGPTGTVIARGSAPVFGLSTKTPLPTADAASQDTAEIPLMMEPGKLDGIVKVGSAPTKALFQGELYQVGERVRGTNFIIVAVEDDFVTLKNGDHVIQRFWHE
jgi:hypothetical protein